MIASYHVIRYRRPRLRDSANLEGSVPGLRRWVPVSTGQRFLPPPKPEFRRWGYLGIWEDDAALQRFLDGSAMAERWGREAVECWHVALSPTFTRGELSWGNPFVDGVRDDLPGSSAVVITWSRLRVLRIPAWLGSLKPAAMDLEETPGLLAALPGFPGVPFVDLMTFSVWESIEHALHYAYRRGNHRAAVKRARSEDFFAQDLIARFYPYWSEGAWDGRDPLADHVASGVGGSFVDGVDA
jgi:hypothetical protein